MQWISYLKEMQVKYLRYFLSFFFPFSDKGQSSHEVRHLLQKKNYEICCYISQIKSPNKLAESLLVATHIQLNGRLVTTVIRLAKILLAHFNLISSLLCFPRSVFNT